MPTRRSRRMSTDILAQWKPGDTFVIRTEYPLHLRFYRDLPLAHENLAAHPNIDLDKIFIVSAVYEELAFTAVKFQNMDARIDLRGTAFPHHGVGPAESYWTVVRHNNQLLCRQIRIRYNPYPSGSRSRNRSQDDLPPI
jgi:hypothetical protein